MAVDFGVAVPNYGDGTSAEKLRAWAQAVERLGFEYAMVTDHVTQPAQVRQVYDEDFFEAFASLSFLSAVTSRIRIGTTVVVLPLRHPLLTARAAATVDRLSGGRMVFGVGVGGSSDEYASLGVDFSRRGAMTDEYLAAITRMWAGDWSFEGEFLRFDDLLPGPAPARPGGPPIWVGGASDAALRRAARFGAAWHPTFPTLEALATGKRKLAELAEAEGRDTPEVAPRITLTITEKAVPVDERPLGVGNPEQIREDLSRLEELGSSAVIVDPVKHRFIYGRLGIAQAALPSGQQDGTELATIEQLANEIADIPARAPRL
ncbi:TIGR03619 family F420-dependent LLM class oxidoreductase [Segniliparus rugosus]|uniref:TIGR03619 family F420-dependent LLM class oxidoreductase n=1 Tax=Segniliparus rugosus TaxID=286804 RepID=UPI0001F04030|nr:TIGR03619 family F420-dependent LLM class oxidoreductase [Segniliparus rugosus]